MADITNSFVRGIMDKDLDERLIPAGVYRDALNIDVDTDEGANIGSARNSLGNTLKGTTIGATNGRTIGAVKDEANNAIYWLVASDTFDAIFEYNEITTTTVRVLKCTKASPTTPSTLNFNQAYLVTAINFINGFLYWSDGFNPPRRVNIARAKSYSVDDTKITDDLQVVLAPPLNPPTLKLYDDGTQANNISEKFLSFATRYKYLDGQYSAISPLSGVAFAPSTYELDYLAGNNKSMVNNYNAVNITFNTGSLNVTDIQLVMCDTRNLNVSVIETFNKTKLALSNNVHYKYTGFSNNKTYTILTSDQITRTFDNVPLLAEAQDFVGNRLMYGNYTQFYDIVDTNKNNIKMDFTVTPTSIAVANGTPTQTWRSDRDYEVALEYLDNYGRHTTALTSTTNTTYISANNSDTSNSLVVEIKNKPPYWATGYRVLIKQSKKGYYNLFPITYYVDGFYRYFLINESDRDKFKVGEYVIFKSDKSGVTHSNKKYKILEFSSKGTNFINGITTIDGLYFKIKVDSITELDNSGEFYYGNDGIGGSQVDTAFYNKMPHIAVSDIFKVAENPIFYGSGNENALSITGNNYNGLYNARIVIEIDSASTYKYSVALVTQTLSPPSLVASNIPIVVNTPFSLFNVTGLEWSQSSGYVIGDKYVINCRCSTLNNLDDESLRKATAIIPSENWSATSPETDRAIEVGATIKITVLEDYPNPSPYITSQIFIPSPARYENIEEWWYESGARNAFIFYDSNGNDIKSKTVEFRRGISYTFMDNTNGTTDFQSNVISQGGIINATTLKYPVRMLIHSSMDGNRNGNNDGYDDNHSQGKIVVVFEITQSDTPTICETEADDNVLDIYHEATRTYRIENNFHQTTWHYQDYTAPTYAIINAIQYTNLGQLNPNGIPVSGNVQHYFEVGDTIFVRWNNSLSAPSGEYTVLLVPNAYNVVINKVWGGAGLATPGSISYSVTDIDQTNYGVAGPAILKINNAQTINSTYNAWTFGNGLESDRIKDDWNAPELQLSPRVNAFIEDYKKKVSYNAICYSGIYGENTSVNRLNEFNLSIANFKYLDSEFGSIQKLYARDTDMLVFQDNKVSKVLYGKNLLFDAVGGATISSIPEILGNQISYPGEWGISKNPESFAEWGNQLYWTDARRGSVLKMSGDQIEIISSLGMTDYFRDLMRDAPNSQKLGGFDPHTRKYNLSANNISVNKCNLAISRSALTVAKGTAPAFGDLFTIITDSSWSISLVSTGFGTSWLTGYSASGFGTQDIIGLVAVNNTGAVRTVIVRVTYCTNLSVDFTLTQARGQKGDVIFIVKNNKRI